MDKPIGYWLKHLHNLLETHFDRTLADLGLGRRHWQVLSTLSRGPRSRADLRQALAPFWEHGQPDLDEILDATHGLSAAGWIDSHDDTVTLTDQGRSMHAEVAARINATRGTVVAGLTPQQYAETVRKLAIMADNIQGDLDRPTVHRGSTAHPGRSERSPSWYTSGIPS